MAIAALILSGCKKENFNDGQNPVAAEGVFTAYLDETKATSTTGVQTFQEGESIDLYYYAGETRTKKSIVLTADMISEAGKKVTFPTDIESSVKVVAAYPGKGTNWTSGVGPKITVANRTEGIASACCEAGAARVLKFKNLLSIISFSADEIPAGATFAYLTDCSGAQFSNMVELNVETGAVNGTNPIGYAFSNQISDPANIRLMVFAPEARTFSKGFTLILGNALGNAPKEFIGKRLYVNKALTVAPNQYIKLGNIDKNTVTYAGETYRTVTLKDGNTWMAENLRYVPEGKSVAELKDDYTGVECDGIYYPATFAIVDGAAVTTPSNNINDILAQGYLYTAAAAMAGEAFPATDWESISNNRGLCPEGWHVPSADEWVDLVGACAASSHNNTSAPYYVQSLSGADLETLNADGFNFLPFPYLNQGMKYSGSWLNKRADSEYNIYSNMLYFQSSTGRSATQNYAAMITNNNSKTSVNCAYNFLTNGCAIRCVKDDPSKYRGSVENYDYQKQELW